MSITKSIFSSQFGQLPTTDVQNAAPLHEYTPTDISSTHRQQSRYRFEADHARLRPVSALVHQHC